MSLPPVALVVGAGDATGGAVARRFARGGYTVCATRRTTHFPINTLTLMRMATGLQLREPQRLVP